MSKFNLMVKILKVFFIMKTSNAGYCSSRDDLKECANPCEWSYDFTCYETNPGLLSSKKVLSTKGAAYTWQSYKNIAENAKGRLYTVKEIRQLIANQIGDSSYSDTKMATRDHNNLGRLVNEIGDMYLAVGDEQNQQWIQIGEGSGTNYPGFVPESYPLWGDSTSTDTTIRNYSMYINNCVNIGQSTSTLGLFGLGKYCGNSSSTNISSYKLGVTSLTTCQNFCLASSSCFLVSLNTDNDYCYMYNINCESQTKISYSFTNLYQKDKYCRHKSDFSSIQSIKDYCKTLSNSDCSPPSYSSCDQQCGSSLNFGQTCSSTLCCSLTSQLASTPYSSATHQINYPITSDNVNFVKAWGPVTQWFTFSGDSACNFPTNTDYYSLTIIETSSTASKLPTIDSSGVISISANKDDGTYVFYGKVQATIHYYVNGKKTFTNILSNQLEINVLPPQSCTFNVITPQTLPQFTTSTNYYELIDPVNTMNIPPFTVLNSGCPIVSLEIVPILGGIDQDFKSTDGNSQVIITSVVSAAQISLQIPNQEREKMFEFRIKATDSGVEFQPKVEYSPTIRIKMINCSLQTVVLSSQICCVINNPIIVKPIVPDTFSYIIITDDVSSNQVWGQQTSWFTFQMSPSCQFPTNLFYTYKLVETIPFEGLKLPTINQIGEIIIPDHKNNGDYVYQGYVEVTIKDLSGMKTKVNSNPISISIIPPHPCTFNIVFEQILGNYSPGKDYYELIYPNVTLTIDSFTVLNSGCPITSHEIVPIIDGSIKDFTSTDGISVITVTSGPVDKNITLSIPQIQETDRFFNFRIKATDSGAQFPPKFELSSPIKVKMIDCKYQEAKLYSPVSVIEIEKEQYQLQNLKIQLQDKFREVILQCPINEYRISKVEQKFPGKIIEDFDKFVEIDRETGELTITNFKDYLEKSYIYIQSYQNTTQNSWSNDDEWVVSLKILKSNKPPSFVKPLDDVVYNLKEFETAVYQFNKTYDLEGTKVKLEIFKGFDSKIMKYNEIETKIEITPTKSGKFTLGVKLTDEDGKSFLTYFDITIVIKKDEVKKSVVPSFVGITKPIEIAEAIKPTISENENKINELLSNPKAIVIMPLQQPNVAAPAAVQTFMDKLIKPKTNEIKEEKQVIEKKKSKDIKLKIDEFTIDGNVRISFNQPLKIPQFQQKDKNGRLLGEKGLSVSDIDVYRDLVEFSFLMNSGQEKKVEYFLELKDWQPMFMDIQMGFTDPLIVSKSGLKDQIIIKIKNIQLFVSEETGEHIKAENSFQIQQCPQLVPKGVDGKKAVKQANDCKVLMFTLIYVQMLVQLGFKNSMVYWFPLYIALQMICYLVIYDQLPIPANATIFIQEFTKAIEFESLNPVGVIRFFNPQFSLEAWLNGEHSHEDEADTLIISQDQHTTLFKDLRMIVVLGVCFVIVMIFMKFLSILSNKHRKYFNEAISGVFQRFIFNGYIGSMMVAFVKLNIAVKTQLVLYNNGSKYLNATSFSGAKFIIFKIIGEFMMVLVLIFVTQGDLSHLKYKRVKRITDGIQIKKNFLNKYYFPIYMIRRVIFAFIPVFLYSYQGFQVQGLIASQQFFMMVHLSLLPHQKFDRNVLEFVNDVLIMFAIYHMACFSEFPYSNIAQYQMGYSFVGVIITMVGCNLYYGISKMIVEYRSEKALIAKRKFVQENLQIILNRDKESKRVRRERRCIKRDVPRVIAHEEEKVQTLLLEKQIIENKIRWEIEYEEREKIMKYEKEIETRNEYIQERMRRLNDIQPSTKYKDNGKYWMQEDSEARFYINETKDDAQKAILNDIEVKKQKNLHIFKNNTFVIPTIQPMKKVKSEDSAPTSVQETPRKIVEIKVEDLEEEEICIPKLNLDLISNGQNNDEIKNLEKSSNILQQQTIENVSPIETRKDEIKRLLFESLLEQNLATTNTTISSKMKEKLIEKAKTDEKWLNFELEELIKINKISS